MLPAIRRAYRRAGAVSAGWYHGRTEDGWSVDDTDIATINLPLRGVYLRDVGGARRLVDPSRSVWFAPGEAGRSCPRSEGPSSGLYVQVSDPLMREIDDQLPRHLPPSTEAPAGPSVVRDAWDALEQASGLPPSDAEDRVIELFLTLLLPLAPPHRASAAVREVQARLAQDPVGSPGPTELARQLGLSRFVLCRQFRAATGRSVLGYREDLRLVRAFERLRSGAPDLAALALELGFSSHSHFTLRFRQRLGRSPSDVRARR